MRFPTWNFSFYTNFIAKISDVRIDGPRSEILWERPIRGRGLERREQDDRGMALSQNLIPESFVILSLKDENFDSDGVEWYGYFIKKKIFIKFQ